MPLMSIPGKAAMANLRAHRSSLWPDGRKDRSRLSGVARVDVQPSFQLVHGEPIFTMGSCFARNIEHRLEDLGYEIPTRGISLPAEERASDTENDILNKYAPHSILNEVRWAIEPGAVFPEAGLLTLSGRRWHDPHLAPNVAPGPLERVLARRESVQALYRQIPRCRVIVMTLGLVEAWFDALTGLYLNSAPPAQVLQDEPDRFRLDVLSPDEVLGVLHELHGLLSRYGHPETRMLLTVSPVPFRSTFTGRDAISANSYSKSALRAAAEMFVLAHDNVDYFPSYEIVTHTVRTSAFIQDNRHVTDDVVAAIVGQVEAAYSPGSAPPEVEAAGAVRLGVRVRQALRTENYAEAIRIFASLEDRDRYLRAGFDLFSFRYEYGRTLMRQDRKAEAQAQLQHAVRARPDSAPAHYNLGLLLSRLQRPLEAEEALRRAVEIEPEVVDRRIRLVLQLIDNHKLDEAREQLAVVVGQQPEHEAALAAMAELGPNEALAEDGRGGSGAVNRFLTLFRNDAKGVATSSAAESASAAAALLRQSMASAPRRAKRA